MLIVVSDAHFFKHEATCINALFDAGLQVFHLRKPNAAVLETTQLLREINSVHLSKIALHQHHSLAQTFGIKRLHFPEAARKSKTAAEYIQLKEEGYTLSTSIHNADEDVDNLFDYAFYGPVFDSISKKGYRSALAENTKIKSHKSKQIAIGGVDGNNCTKAFEMGFAGVAVLGAIWQSPEPINEFIKIQSKCNSIAQL